LKTLKQPRQSRRQDAFYFGPAHSRPLHSWTWLVRAATFSLLTLLMIQPTTIAAEMPANRSAATHSAPANSAGNNSTADAALPDPVLKVMQTELKRATTSLAKSDPAPYYMSYTVYDQTSLVLAGSYGSLTTNAGFHRRQADVTMRVG